MNSKHTWKITAFLIYLSCWHLQATQLTKSSSSASTGGKLIQGIKQSCKAITQKYAHHSGSWEEATMLKQSQPLKIDSHFWQTKAETYLKAHAYDTLVNAFKSTDHYPNVPPIYGDIYIASLPKPT